MKFYKWYAVSLFMFVQIIAGCGGGGGGGGAIVLPPADTTAPNVISFTMPPTSSSMTVGISNFSAVDTVGVTGYMVTESATAPAASASGWFSSEPASFTFATAGTKTAYAWAKDAAGNVSTSRSAGVAITLPTTKTVTWKISSGSATQVERIGGFELTVILPVGSVVPTEIKNDSNNNPVVVPLPSAVYLSGIFQGASALSSNTFSYDNAFRELKINYPTTDNFGLGEFITIVTTVPISYTPSTNDINITLFKAFAPLTGANLPSVTATAAFN
jgi:hypothetical protein